GNETGRHATKATATQAGATAGARLPFSEGAVETDVRSSIAACQNRHRPIGHDEIARVRRGDTVLLRQQRDFIDQLFFLAVEPDLIEEIADLPSCPHMLHE